MVFAYTLVDQPDISVRHLYQTEVRVVFFFRKIGYEIKKEINSQGQISPILTGILTVLNAFVVQIWKSIMEKAMSDHGDKHKFRNTLPF